jgi:predicted RNA-binding Zn-ribbon protein involved in translation (DUF1610 family)
MKDTFAHDIELQRLSWKVAIRICPKCNSWRVQAGEYVIRYYRCPDCGWMGISYVEKSLQLFRSIQRLRLLRRSSWVYVIFFLVILGGGYLLYAKMIPPAEYVAFQDEAPLFSDRIETAGEINSKSLTTEAPVILSPSIQAVPSLPVVSPAGSKRVSLQQPEKFHVVANSSSKLYHLPGMKYYNKIPRDRRVIFPSEEAARQTGYRKAPR